MQQLHQLFINVLQTRKSFGVQSMLILSFRNYQRDAKKNSINERQIDAYEEVP